MTEEPAAEEGCCHKSEERRTAVPTEGGKEGRERLRQERGKEGRGRVQELLLSSSAHEARRQSGMRCGPTAKTTASRASRSPAGSKAVTTAGKNRFPRHTAMASRSTTCPTTSTIVRATSTSKRTVDTEKHCLDWGFRGDVVYGTDAQKTQGFRRQRLGHKLGQRRLRVGDPQAYVDVGYGDLLVRVGHFYTKMGYETVTATGNFFFSHALTHCQQRAIHAYGRLRRLQGQRRSDRHRRLGRGLG